MTLRGFIVAVAMATFIAAAQMPFTNSPPPRAAIQHRSTPQITLTGVAAFAPRKWAFITIRTGTQETFVTLKEGEEKAGITLHSVNAEAAQARVSIEGVKQTLSFGAPLPRSDPELLAKEHRDREHARISALRAQQDRERDAQELTQYLEALRKTGIPIREANEDDK